MELTREMIKQKAIGEHYFLAMFDGVEGESDTIGYFDNYEEAVKACKQFAEQEIEYFYDSEFDVIEYELRERENGKKAGFIINAWRNDLSFNMYQFIQNDEHI